MGTQTVVDVRPKRVHPTTLAEIVRLVTGHSAQPIAGVSVTGVANATRLIQPGDLFAALPGGRTHGAKFAGDAQQHGAVAVLTDEEGATLLPETVHIPVIVCADPRRHLGAVSALIYGNTRSRLTTIGVTGTNGKTTVTYFVEAILTEAGIVTGMSATPERHVGSTIVGSGLTTPEAPVLQGMIARMRELGAQALSLEVSAQAVSKHRIGGIHFDAVGFMNLSAEHLDEYHDMDTYFRAKRGLFTPEYADRAVVSLADPWGQKLVEEAEIPTQTLVAQWWPQSALSASADWVVGDFADTEMGCRCTVTDLYGHRFEISADLPGRHVAVDAAMAVALVATAGVPRDVIDAALAHGALERPYIPGRLEQMSGPGAPLVIVDYAHTPTAMAETLVELRRRTPGRLITAFGADGGRDPFKRPGMAQAAAQNADLTIICDAHPRREDPAQIRAQLLEAARAVPGAEVLEIPDPASAIDYAVGRLKPGDTFVVLGPGDEDYRAVGDREIPYSARNEARRALAEHGWPVSQPVERMVDQ